VSLPPLVDPGEVVLYCLTRDTELAAALDARLACAVAFFYNDAARLHQALVLRAPDFVVVDTGAIREEYGDAGLAPVVAFLRRRAPEARLSVRPVSGAERLVAAEAGPGVLMLPAAPDDCVAAVAAACGCD
jgi:hypothetical protein